MNKSVATEAEVLATASLICGICGMVYKDYKRLVEHMYWRHGTQGYRCTKCTVKQWPNTSHKCGVLPIKEHDSNVDNVDSDDSQYYSGRETEFCYCGKNVPDAPMIGCDGPHCVYEWFHFRCVGIETATEDDWLCPTCSNTQTFDETCTARRTEGFRRKRKVREVER